MFKQFLTFFLELIFYIIFGDYMIIYLDLVFLINFIMDLYILIGVKFLLRLNVKFYKLLMGALIGSLSLFLLFFKLSIFYLNLLKIFISVFMTYVSFGKNNFFNKLFYLYIISIILGGSFYLINDTFGYEVESFIFISNGYSVNLIILLIISPLVILLYVIEYLKLKKKINVSYNVIIKFRNKELNLEGFLDTGNKLVDPYFHRPIILLNKKLINIKNKKVLYVPYSSLNNNGLLKCIIPEYIILDNIKYDKVLVGISENLKYDCILNERLIDL